MIHGVATLKKDIVIDEKVLQKEGTQSMITAYLPEENIYAIIFNGIMDANHFFRFSSKDDFENYCDYKLFEDLNEKS